MAFVVIMMFYSIADDVKQFKVCLDLDKISFLRFATVRAPLAAGISCFLTEINKLLNLNLTLFASAQSFTKII